MVDEDLGLFVGTMFKSFFDMPSKDYNSKLLSASRISLSLATTVFMKEVAKGLRQNNKLNFDESQFLFITPITWYNTEYEDKLYSLLLQANWIDKDNLKNRLIIVPFLESFIYYLQNSIMDDSKKFEREAKYLLCSMNPKSELSDSVRLTHFRVQSAKELSAISKKAAFSDILLASSILDTGKVYFSFFTNSIRDAVYNIVQQTSLINIGHADNNTSNNYRAMDPIEWGPVRRTNPINYIMAQYVKDATEKLLNIDVLDQIFADVGKKHLWNFCAFRLTNKMICSSKKAKRINLC